MKIVTKDIFSNQMQSIHKNLPFLLEKNRWVEKVEKLIQSIKDKGNSVIHVRASKQALNPSVSNKKSTQSNSVERKSMVKAIY